MDTASVLGFVVAFGLLVFSIMIGGNPLNLYWDLPSFLMVFGGSFGSMMVTTDFATIKLIPTFLRIIFKIQPYNYPETISQLVGFSESARKEGLLSLDDAIKDITSPFLSTGLRLVVDGTDPSIIQRILKLELSKMSDRHKAGADFFFNWTTLGPSFGMLGTVSGMIGMLANLSDTSSVGRGMALALITTFYGAILANMLCTPIMVKLIDRHAQEVLHKTIMLEGILSIQSGDNPHILEQKLYSFLPPKDRPVAKDVG
jgi:chemotaxis protein MotA